MKSFSSEDNIEQAIFIRLSQPGYGWQRIACDPGIEGQDVLSATGRQDVKPRLQVMSIIKESPGNDLPESYDREVFATKTDLLMNHFTGMAVQGCGWLTA